MMQERSLPPLVSAEWLATRLDHPDLVVVEASVTKMVQPDGSYSWEAARCAFAEEGHIPGARFADLVAAFSDPAAPFPFTRPSAAAFAAAATTIGLSNQQQIVVYDRATGVWAARLWWLLRAYGHDAVAVLDGGLQSWVAAGGTLAFGPVVAGSGSFTAHYRPYYFVDTPEVLAVVEGRAPGILVCALRRSVFRGKEQVYARTGHIPGSYNLPYVEQLDPATNRLVAVASLRARFAPVFTWGERIITYCGGGITAAGTALALTLAGASNIAVYDGSLSAWSADNTLPMTTLPF
jgi:thiosulfate/3-mercaptopyruvate sulfurtransferase